MKKYIFTAIISVSFLFGGCYTEIGYDYEREAYWDEVEEVKVSELPNN